MIIFPDDNSNRRVIKGTELIRCMGKFYQSPYEVFSVFSNYYNRCATS